MSSLCTLNTSYLFNIIQSDSLTHRFQHGDLGGQPRPRPTWSKAPADVLIYPYQLKDIPGIVCGCYSVCVASQDV